MLDSSKFERVGLSAITEIQNVRKVLVTDVTPGQFELLTTASVDVEEVR